jgi:cytochrome c556
MGLARVARRRRRLVMSRRNVDYRFTLDKGEMLMFQRIARRAVLLGAVALVAVVTYQATDAAITKGKSRAAETKYLMRGVSQPNCAAIGKMLKDSGPADDKAWDDLVCDASLLNEVSYLLMDDGRCPDKTWADAAKTMREESSKIIDAAKAKNLADAQSSFKLLTTSCGACHKGHKK